MRAAERVVRDPKARGRVLEAAGRVVAAQGVHGASLRAIAAEAGVTTGFVTHYFADKQDLMENLMLATNETAARRVLKTVRSAGRPLEGLQAAVDAMLPLDAARRQEW